MWHGIRAIAPGKPLCVVGNTIQEYCDKHGLCVCVWHFVCLFSWFCLFSCLLVACVFRDDVNCNWHWGCYVRTMSRSAVGRALLRPRTWDVDAYAADGNALCK